MIVKGMLKVAAIQIDADPKGDRERKLGDLAKRLGLLSDESNREYRPLLSRIATEATQVHRQFIDLKNAAVLSKATAIFEHCRTKGAEVLVFPEYSIPAAILQDLDRLFRHSQKPFLIVAGSHPSNDSPHLNAIYTNLGTSRAAIGCRPCPCAPVFLNNGNGSARWFLIPKMAPSLLEKQNVWEVSTAGWRLLDFKGHMISVEICSDFVNAGSHAEIGAIRHKIDEAVLALVPACNPKVIKEWFGPEFVSRWHVEDGKHRQKTIYANASEHGDSLVFCNDGAHGRQVLEDVCLPFALDRVIYRMPKACEGVVINHIRLDNSNADDRMVSVAPLVSKKLHPGYCAFYSSYRRTKRPAKKLQLVREYCANSSFHEDRKRSTGAFAEKLNEAFSLNPNFDDLDALALDGLIDVIPLNTPGEAEIHVCLILEQLKLDIHAALLPVSDSPETLEPLLSLYKTTCKELHDWKHKYGISTDGPSNDPTGGAPPSDTPHGGGQISRSPKSAKPKARKGAGVGAVTGGKEVSRLMQFVETYAPMPMSSSRVPDQRRKGFLSIISDLSVRQLHGTVSLEQKVITRLAMIYSADREASSLRQLARDLLLFDAKEKVVVRLTNTSTPPEQPEHALMLHVGLGNIRSPEQLDHWIHGVGDLFLEAILDPVRPEMIKVRTATRSSLYRTLWQTVEVYAYADSALATALHGWLTTVRGTNKMIAQDLGLALCGLDPASRAGSESSADFVLEAGTAIEALAWSILASVVGLAKTDRMNDNDTTFAFTAGLMSLLDGSQMRRRLHRILRSQNIVTPVLVNSFISAIEPVVDELVRLETGLVRDIEQALVKPGVVAKLSSSVCESTLWLHSAFTILGILLQLEQEQN